MKTKMITLQLGLVAAVSLLGGCGEKKIAEERTSDTSHNIFTGNDTVTQNKDTVYKNRHTGAVRKESVKKETKYDENGNVVSGSQEVEAR